MQIQCLNKPQGNYVRRCWGTTPISGEVGLTARLHPLRRAAPVTSRCTRYVALHPIRRGALPTDRVHCLRIGCTAQRWNTPQKTLPPPHVSPAGRNTRNHKTPSPNRNNGTRAHWQHLTTHGPSPQTPPQTQRGRGRFPGHGLATQSAPLSEAPPIRRSCPRGPRPRRGQPRGGRRGRGTGSRTRSPGPHCGRSGSTAGRHRARHTRRA